MFNYVWCSGLCFELVMVICVLCWCYIIYYTILYYYILYIILYITIIIYYILYTILFPSSPLLIYLLLFSFCSIPLPSHLPLQFYSLPLFPYYPLPHPNLLSSPLLLSLSSSSSSSQISDPAQIIGGLVEVCGGEWYLVLV